MNFTIFCNNFGRGGGKLIAATVVLLTGSLSFAQLSYDPPANVLHHIQYQQRTEHYVLLPEGANFQALNALERLSLIPQNEYATVDEYADEQGFTYTFLEHTWDSTAHEWMLKRKRTLLSPYGVRAWDQENQLISAADATPEALAAAQERQADVLEHGILDSPDFTPPTEAQVEALIAAGVEVAWEPNQMLQIITRPDTLRIDYPQMQISQHHAGWSEVTRYQEGAQGFAVPMDQTTRRPGHLYNGQCMEAVTYRVWETYTALVLDGQTLAHQNRKAAEFPEALEGNSIRAIVYPNPATAQLNYPLSPAMQRLAFGVRVTDVTGTTVLHADHPADAPATLDVQPLAPGMYFLHIDLYTGTQVFRFLKQ